MKTGIFLIDDTDIFFIDDRDIFTIDDADIFTIDDTDIFAFDDTDMILLMMKCFYINLNLIDTKWLYNEIEHIWMIEIKEIEIEWMSKMNCKERITVGVSIYILHPLYA